MKRCIHCSGLISEKQEAATREKARRRDRVYVPPVACSDCLADIADARAALKGDQ